MKRPLRNSASRTAAATRPRRPGWRLSTRTLWWTWVTIGWTVSLALLGWGMLRLERQVYARGAAVPCRLEWVGLPAWLEEPNGKGMLDEVTAASGLRDNDDIHDPQLCARVGRDLGQSPWVAKVIRVAKRPDGAVRVRAEFRTPYAYVDVNGRAYMVDNTGVRLPPECATSMVSPKDRLDWIVITGVSGRLPALRERWAGKDLAAGLALLEFLREEEGHGRLPFGGWLMAIDVTNFDRPDGELRIRTINPRCYIHWGAPPGQEVRPENTAAGKLDNLRSIYRSQGQFPDHPIDVRPEDNPWAIKPLEAEPTSNRR